MDTREHEYDENEERKRKWWKEDKICFCFSLALYGTRKKESKQHPTTLALFVNFVDCLPPQVKDTIAFAWTVRAICLAATIIADALCASCNAGSKLCKYRS